MTKKKANRKKKAKGEGEPQAGGGGPAGLEKMSFQEDAPEEVGSQDDSGGSQHGSDKAGAQSNARTPWTEAVVDDRITPDPCKDPELKLAEKSKQHEAQSLVNPNGHDPRIIFRTVSADKISAMPSTTDVYATRPTLSIGGSRYKVLTNHFKIDLESSKECVIYEYRIDGIENDRTRPKKRVLMEAAIDHCPVLWQQRDSYATDHMSKIVATKDLALAFDPDRRTAFENEVVATVPVTDFDKRDHTSATLTLSVVFVRKHVLWDLHSHAHGNDIRYPGKDDATAALNLLLAKHPLQQAMFRAGSNRLFMKSGWEELTGQHKVLCRGYSYNVKAAMGSLLLNFNTAMSLFYQPVTVAEYLEERGNTKQDLYGVRVWVKVYRRAEDSKTQDARNTAQARTKTISEITTGHADAQYAYTENGTRYTVWQHMKYYYLEGDDLRDDEKTKGSQDSVCVNTNPLSSSTKVWFLAEDLLILPYQIYRRKLEGELTSAMILKACRKPQQNINAIMSEGMPAIRIAPGSKRPQLLEQAGIHVMPGMLHVPARLINPPRLRFAAPNASEAIPRGSWALNPQWQFLETGNQFSGSGAFFLLPYHEARLRDQRHDQLLGQLGHFYQHYTSNGLRGLGTAPAAFNATNSLSMPNRNRWSYQDVEIAVTTALQNKPSLIILILPAKDKENQAKYSQFKSVMDQKHGLPSLCMCASKLYSSVRHSTNPADPGSAIAGHVRNVGMKLNLRLGNVNHSLDPAAFYVLPKTGDEEDTIILGADVIHPGALSIEGTPSIAALVGSVDDSYSKYLGSMRRQPFDPKKQSKEIIEPGHMKGMVVERLRAWKEAHGNKRCPTNILYYCDGVGESQYAKVREDEISMIREAYTVVAHNTPQNDTEPRITAVVVEKRHNIRLYPDDPDDPREATRKGNCQPGTVVDSVITSPYFFGFYLIAHNGIQGTARPTHYFVLENGIGLGAQQLQDFTNALCYTY